MLCREPSLKYKIKKCYFHHYLRGGVISFNSAFGNSGLAAKDTQAWELVQPIYKTVHVD